MATYDVVSHWADIVRRHAVTCKCGYLDEVLGNHDLTTPKGIKDLADAGVAALQNNLVSGVQDAVSLWQATQCLKKFKFGCAASQEEMQQGWLERNEALRAVRLPLWLRVAMRELLSPLADAFEAADVQGRFGNGAVYETAWKTVHSRWTHVSSFTYNVRDPDDISWWNGCPFPHTRLSCVPKDMLKLRTISVEPAEGTFLQQLNRNRLICAASQVIPTSSAIPAQAWGGGPEIQRARALRGSLDGTLATIDLSDASDSISLQDVVDVFPSNIVAELERARSTIVECPALAGKRVDCIMYAGMGNATTFIVESLYFWALFTAICRRLGVFTPVSVFGDDIVLATKAALHPLFTDYVASAHVKVNMLKSGLSDGPGFREACGLAAFKGIELPLLRINGYRLTNPVEQVSLCSLVNCCLDPGSRYAPFVRYVGLEVGAALVKELRCPVLPVPLSREGVYLVDPSETIGVWSYRARWSAGLQHPQVKVKVLRPRLIRRRYRTITAGERTGILHGQLRTVFSEGALGYHSRYHEFEYPVRDASNLESTWVDCWSMDASLIDLVE